MPDATTLPSPTLVGTAIVTGAGSGIGRASAQALLAAGWNVVLAGRREAALVETVETAGTVASRARVVPTDVTDAAAVARLFAAAVQRHGRIDFVFNNAGVPAPTIPTIELPEASWNDVIGTCVTGAFLVLREAMRTMAAQSPRGGRILNTGSIAAHSPRPDTIAYTTAKHALTGMTRSAALDGRRHGIAVGQIDLGNVAVGRVGEQDGPGVPTRDRVQADGSLAPETLLRPQEVAQSVVHLAGLPLHLNVLFQTLMPTTMPFVGRG